MTLAPQNGDPTWEQHLTGNYATQPSPDPVRPGYQFTGWYTAPTGGSKWDFANTKVTADMTLYGQWQKLPTVTFHPCNGDPDTSVTLPTVGSTTASVMPANTSKQYHDFAGWFTTPSGGTPWNVGTPVNTDLDLYGQWKRRTHQVTLDADGGTGGPATPRTVNEGDPIGTIANLPAKLGHHISSWTNTATGNPWNLAGDPVMADMTLKAVWEPDMYTVRFLNPDSPAAPPADQHVPYGGSVGNPANPAIPVYPDEAAPDFKGWFTSQDTRWDFRTATIGPDQANNSHIMVLTAKWTRRVTITYDLGQAAGDLSITAQTIDKDTTLNAPTPGAWSHGTFNGWYTD
ncbi:hypothetical protein CRD60_08075, partial [Bifidobacterium aemilianum]